MSVTHPGRSEVARFLAQRPPFDVLSPAELAELIADTELEFHPAGTVILSEDGGPVTLLRVIHSGAVDLTHDGRLLDLLGPGDTFGHAPMLSGLPAGFQASAAQDTLCYRIPVAAAGPLLERARTRELAVGATDSGNQPVARLIRVQTVYCEPEDSIREVAQRMTEMGASCAIVPAAGGGLGIVTDRDIRSKVVAAGESLSTPVAKLMSTPVYSVTPDRLGSEVLFEMLEKGISHAPVVGERGQVVGVVEDTDLFAMGPRSWFGVRRQVDRAETIDDLARIAGRLPAIVFERGRVQLRATDLVRVFSALIDAVTVRALELATESNVAAGEGVVWVAVGSHARRELTAASPVRGAIVCTQAPSAWIETAGEALRRTGLAGEVIARTAEQWCEGAPTDELAQMLLVERRALWGSPQRPLPVATGELQSIVVQKLAQRAMECRPPTGFEEHYVLEADGRRSEQLDIRRAAVLPIMALGRWAGAIAGVLDGSTGERLTAAAEASAISNEDACTLTDAFALALELRVSHHIELLSAGRPPDDSIDPRLLSPLMRDELRDVFRAIAAVQRKLRE